MPGLTSALWKSSECGMSTCIDLSVPLVIEKATVVPSSTTIGVETPVPRWYLPLTAKLQTSVGARSLETWVTCWKTSTSTLVTGAGSVGSTFSNDSNATPLDSASVGAGASAAGAVAAGAETGAGAGGRLVVARRGHGHDRDEDGEHRDECREADGDERPVALGILDPLDRLVVDDGRRRSVVLLRWQMKVGGHVVQSLAGVWAYVQSIDARTPAASVESRRRAGRATALRARPRP